MKLKLTLIMAAIFMSGLLVNAANPAFPQGKTPSQKSAPSSLSQANKIHLNGKANRNAIINDASLSKPRRAASTGGNGQIISPSGKPFDYLYSYCLMDGWGDSYIAGKHVNIYYDDSDNSLYLGNFLDEYMGDCYYVGGKLIEGDLQNGVMEFETRKAVYYSYGNWLMLIIASYDEKTGDFYVNDEETTFKLYAKDGVISNYDTFLALASVTNDTDVYWLQSDICYDPIDMSTANTVEIPASATLNHYYQTVNGDSESIASVYRDGDDFYFNNVFEQGFTFLGHLDNNKIKIELPQLVKCDDEFVYVNTYYSVGDDQYKPGSDEAIWFDFDPKTGDISYEGAAITLFSGNKFLYSSAVLNIASLDLVMFTADEEPTEVPASAVQKLYTMSTGYDFQGNHKAGLMKIARDGNTVYFMRVDNNDYNVVMKGELDPATNKVTVPLSH